MTYLYRSVESAVAGDHFGGSGFLIHIPSEHEGWIHLYAVTNKHVVDDGGFRILRLNTVDGTVATIKSEPESWTRHQDGDDIAVMPIKAEDKRFRWFSVPIDKFISQETITDYRIGPGDEAFLIGRLVTMGGRQKNTPVVRFGNLSMMADPSEPVVLRGHEQEAFLVECRSLSGFSGSPAFVTTEQAYGPGHLPKQYRPGVPDAAKTGSRIFEREALDREETITNPKVLESKKE